MVCTLPSPNSSPSEVTPPNPNPVLMLALLCRRFRYFELAVCLNSNRNPNHQTLSSQSALTLPLTLTLRYFELAVCLRGKTHHYLVRHFKVGRVVPWVCIVLG